MMNVSRTIARGFALMLVLSPGAVSAADRPSPLNPKPILIPVGGAGEVEIGQARTLLGGYFAEGGWGGSTIDAEEFAACADGEGQVACVRETLKPLRVQAGEVAIAVLAAPDGDGGVVMTCIGGSRSGQWANESAQRVRFTAEQAADRAQRARAETCVGRAYGEYMIP